MKCKQRSNVFFLYCKVSRYIYTFSDFYSLCLLSRSYMMQHSVCVEHNSGTNVKRQQ